MSSFEKGLRDILKAWAEFFKALPALFAQFIPFFRDLFRALKRGCYRPPRGGCCVDLPPGVHKRPDPMLYSQYWMMKQGLAVSWDNPDIQLEDMAGNPVSSPVLDPDRDYRVIVRVWNNSYDAPAAGLPVYLSFLSFGIGTVSTAIDSGFTNLGVKGSPHCPAFAPFVWHTPAIAGHYCLQALLVWPDDANPENNLGQKNTNIGKAHSPAEFRFPVHNDAAIGRHFELQADSYRLPFVKPCRDYDDIPRGKDRHTESLARWDRVRAAQSYGRFPVAPDWNVIITPAALDLLPNETRQVTVSIEPVAGVFTGTQPINIHGFASAPHGPPTLAGGVTLYYEGS